MSKKIIIALPELALCGEKNKKNKKKKLKKSEPSNFLKVPT
jgi:hypothetical protein